MNELTITWTGYTSIGRSNVMMEYAPKYKDQLHFSHQIRFLIVKLSDSRFRIECESHRFKAWGKAGPDRSVMATYPTLQDAKAKAEEYLLTKERRLVEEWEDCLAESKWLINIVYIDYGRNNCRYPVDRDAEPIVCDSCSEAKELLKQLERENNFPKNNLSGKGAKWEIMRTEGYVFARALNDTSRRGISYSLDKNQYNYSTY